MTYGRSSLTPEARRGEMAPGTAESATCIGFGVSERMRGDRFWPRQIAGLAVAAAAAMAPAFAHADFRVCNGTPARVGVAVGYKDGDTWITEGWWNLPAQCLRDFDARPAGRAFLLCVRDRLRPGRRVVGQGVSCAHAIASSRYAACRIASRAVSIGPVSSKSTPASSATGPYSLLSKTKPVPPAPNRAKDQNKTTGMGGR